MKDAFQQQHESEANGDMMIGPNGKQVMTPEAAQRKVARDRANAEEVSRCEESFRLFATMILPATFTFAVMRTVYEVANAACGISQCRKATS